MYTQPGSCAVTTYPFFSIYKKDPTPCFVSAPYHAKSILVLDGKLYCKFLVRDFRDGRQQEARGCPCLPEVGQKTTINPSTREGIMHHPQGGGPMLWNVQLSMTCLRES